MIYANDVGGWVSVVPFMLHLFVLNDVPIVLWLMVLPGVYIGAQVYIFADTVRCALLSANIAVL
jgi:hypothetical protein